MKKSLLILRLCPPNYTSLYLMLITESLSILSWKGPTVQVFSSTSFILDMSPQKLYKHYDPANKTFIILYFCLFRIGNFRSRQKKKTGQRLFLWRFLFVLVCGFCWWVGWWLLWELGCGGFFVSFFKQQLFRLLDPGCQHVLTTILHL